MKILALDVSTKSTGWFVTKRSCGKIVPNERLSFGEKLVFFRQELEKLLRKYKPDVVVIEDSYYRPGFGNIHTLKTLVKFAGVAIELCTAYSAEVEIITASTARKYCCGDHEGVFKKQDVFDYFVDKYDLAWDYEGYNDITDAMALSFGYREMRRVEAKKKKAKTRRR